MSRERHFPRRTSVPTGEVPELDLFPQREKRAVLPDHMHCSAKTRAAFAAFKASMAAIASRACG